MEGHAASDCCERSSREVCAGGVVGSLHGSEGSRMNRNKSNREKGREKRRPARDLRKPPQATASQLPGSRFSSIEARGEYKSDQRRFSLSTHLNESRPIRRILYIDRHLLCLGLPLLDRKST